MPGEWYRLRGPNLVLAVEVKSDNYKEIEDFVGSQGQSFTYYGEIHHVKLNTPSGMTEVPKGDFIVKWHDGLFYHCTKKFMDDYYQKVDSPVGTR